MEGHRGDGRGSKRESFSRESWGVEQTRKAVGYHVIHRLVDDRGIARTPTALRVASTIIREQGKDRGLVCYRFADTHAHSMLDGSREDAGKFARYSESSLRGRLAIPVPFERSRIRPIGDEKHGFNTLRYQFKQEAHHGTCFDELHEGSSLPDLLGMRMDAPWLVERARRLFPRLTRAMLLEWLGVPELDAVVPDLQWLTDAAAAVWLLPELAGDALGNVLARRAAVHLRDRIGPAADAHEVADLLGISRRSVDRYRSQPVDPHHVRAVELQLKLRTFVRGRSGLLVPESEASLTR